MSNAGPSACMNEYSVAFFRRKVTFVACTWGCTDVQNMHIEGNKKIAPPFGSA